jgi:hypothetical protein
MNRSRPVIIIAAAACIIAGLFAATMQGGNKVYEIRPQINTSDYLMNPAAAVYQHTLDEYKAVVEERLAGISASLETITKQLDSIDAKLTRVSARLTKIEKTLGRQPARDGQKETIDKIDLSVKAADQNEIETVLPAKQ